jgi:hypothetical protein
MELLPPLNSLESESLPQLIRIYQSYTNTTFLRYSFFSTKFLSALSFYQRSLRRLSLLHTTLDAPSSQLFELLLSGSLISDPDPDRPLPRMSLAFPNTQIFMSIPFFINFLRSHPKFFSFLMFSHIAKYPDDAHALSFSTISTVFQTGWCVEESVLWLNFLEEYLLHIANLSGGIDPSSPHLKPYSAFFIQKLAFDFIQLCLFDDIERLLSISDIKACRVHFVHVGPQLVPDKYIQILADATCSIVSKFRFHLSRIPPVVRRLLTSISNVTLKISSFPNSGVSLATFFFITAAIAPILKAPVLIGISEPPSFVTDDIADILFHMNCPSVLFIPPLTLTIRSQFDSTDFQLNPLISDLICRSTIASDAFSTEFQESEIISLFRRYQKAVVFLPLDLHRIHGAAVEFASAGTHLCSIAELSRFDYLLSTKPQIDESRKFDPFVVEFPLLNAPSDPPDDPDDIPAGVAHCFRSVLADVHADLFDAADPLAALSYIGRGRSDPALSIACQYTHLLTLFLVGEINGSRRSLASRTDLSVSVRLRSRELKILRCRLSSLNRTALHCANGRFVRTSMRRLLFQDPSGCAGWTERFCVDAGREFSDVSGVVIRGLRRIAEQRCSSPAAAKCIGLVESTLYIELVDRINVESLAGLKWVALTVGRMAENEKRIFDEMCARVDIQPSVVRAATELLDASMCRCPFSRMIRGALGTVAIIAAAVPKEGNRNEGIQDAIATCFARSSRRQEVILYLVLWGFFVQSFFPNKNHFLDLLGGGDCENWVYFEYLFERLKSMTVTQ